MPCEAKRQKGGREGDIKNDKERRHMEKERGKEGKTQQRNEGKRVVGGVIWGDGRERNDKER